jgi:hypothetical protein
VTVHVPVIERLEPLASYVPADVGTANIEG